MEELLAFLLDVFGEVLLELIVSLISRALRGAFDTDEISRPALAAVGFGLLGASLAAVSWLIFPHPFFPPSRFHGISVLLSPTATGSIMALLGFNLRRRGKEPTAIESFTCGFAFAFGFSLIRLLLAR